MLFNLGDKNKITNDALFHKYGYLYVFKLTEDLPIGMIIDKLHINPIVSLKELVKISKFKNTQNQVPFPTLVGYLGYPMIQYIENIKLETDNPVMYIQLLRSYGNYIYKNSIHEKLDKKEKSLYI